MWLIDYWCDFLFSIVIWVFHLFYVSSKNPSYRGQQRYSSEFSTNLHFSGSMKKIGFKWALLCNSLVLYIAIPMQTQACRLNKYQITWVRVGVLLKVCNLSRVTQTRSESSSFKEKANVIFKFQIWIHCYKTCFLCIFNSKGRTNDSVSYKRWNREKFNKSSLAKFFISWEDI